MKASIHIDGEHKIQMRVEGETEAEDNIISYFGKFSLKSTVWGTGGHNELILIRNENPPQLTTKKAKKK